MAQFQQVHCQKHTILLVKKKGHKDKSDAMWQKKKERREERVLAQKKRSDTLVWLFRHHTNHSPLVLKLRGSVQKNKLLRPYQEESTTSRLISEVKPFRAWLVLGLETTWEHQVS